jgi:L-amino acid N-acyltransferase YncA
MDDLDSLFDERERALGMEWLERHERGELYVAVAEVDGVPVGRRCLDLTSQSGAAYAFGATVWGAWRSRGIGSMLDDHLEEVALARGFRTLRSSVEKGNVRSKAWHERLGDRCVGESVRRWPDASGREVVVECWEFERPLGSFSLLPWLRKRRRRNLRLRRAPWRRFSSPRDKALS